MAAILDGKEVKARLPIPLTVVTSENVDSVEPAF
jgi:ribose transport system substrate-binding protein